MVKLFRVPPSSLIKSEVQNFKFLLSFWSKLQPPSSQCMCINIVNRCQDMKLHIQTCTIDAHPADKNMRMPVFYLPEIPTHFTTFRNMVIAWLLTAVAGTNLLCTVPQHLPIKSTLFPRDWVSYFHISLYLSYNTCFFPFDNHINHSQILFPSDYTRHYFNPTLWSNCSFFPISADILKLSSKQAIFCYFLVSVTFLHLFQSYCCCFHFENR